MGRNKNEHLEGLLVQKDQEIAALETQVQAYIARTSILYTRLLSTLNALDVIKSDQTKERDAMVQINRDLKDKLDVYSAFVNAAELEKDDMRDAVLQLVEKVELSNDYSMWPHSQIRLSSLAGGPIFQSPVVQTSDPDLLLYATTMIETLRRERDLERRAHIQTRDSTQAQIVSLAAQLSRRDAELESCISCAAHTVSAIQRGHPRDAGQLIDEPLISEQVISALDARNKILEIENRGLFERLEDARLAASSSNLDGPPPPPSDGLQQRREIQQPSKAIPSAVSPHNPILQEFQSTCVLRPLGLETVVSERSGLNDADQTLVLPNSNFLDYKTIQDLDRQIKTLGATIDSFAEARRSISAGLPPDVHKGDLCCSVEMRLQSLESENHRLKLSERDLRDELDAVRISAQARENELLDKIKCLQSNQQLALEETNSGYNLLEPENGEMSMELSTPLLPTAILDMNGPHITSFAPCLDPPSIPLPPSPDNHPISSSPVLPHIILSDKDTPHYHDWAVNEVENSAKALHPP